jgi:alkaline phosphatase D
VILLDTRWFRSPLLGEKQHYRPNPDPAATLLGDAQWAWLTEQLRKPAEVRVLASSIQVVADEHGFEKWANFPAERARLLRAIAEAGAAGVVVVSGDRHRGELSLLAESPVGYPLFDLTASSLNLPIVRDEANRHRLGPLVTVANFGLVEIDWNPPAPSLTLRLVDEAGATVLEQRVPLERLSSRRRPG